MNILFLCMDMTGLHGSPLHVLEYGEYFVRKGWNVIIGSVYISDDVKALAMSKGIKVCMITHIPKIEFDIVYALHLLLFPTLLLSGLRYKKAILASLSAYLPIEQIPPLSFISQFNLVTTISKEIVEVQSDKYKVDPNIFTIIPNHIPLSFIEKSNVKTKWNKQIKNICIVSNHYVDELAKLKNIVHFNVDLVGSKYNNIQLITPEFLLNYDIVITIGKTVQYALGLGIPVFEYDMHGGCGYITPENLSIEEATNFSGRGTKKFMSPESILSFLENGYLQAIKDAEPLRYLALKRYSINTLIEKQLNLINSKNTVRPKLAKDGLLFANAAYAAISYLVSRTVN